MLRNHFCLLVISWVLRLTSTLVIICISHTLPLNVFTSWHLNKMNSDHPGVVHGKRVAKQWKRIWLPLHASRRKSNNWRLGLVIRAHSMWLVLFCTVLGNDVFCNQRCPLGSCPCLSCIHHELRFPTYLFRHWQNFTAGDEFPVAGDGFFFALSLN